MLADVMTRLHASDCTNVHNRWIQALLEGVYVADTVTIHSLTPNFTSFGITAYITHHLLAAQLYPLHIPTGPF